MEIEACEEACRYLDSAPIQFPASIPIDISQSGK